MITRFDTIHDVTDSRTDGHTPHNDAPVRRVPVGILPKVRFGVGKNRMVWLPDGERNLKKRLLFSIENTSVTE